MVKEGDTKSSPLSIYNSYTSNGLMGISYWFSMSIALSQSKWSVGSYRKAKFP